MKLALALLLVASQLNVQVQSRETDLSCEDNDVFQAVDAALTTYNTQRSSGSQYVLYRITGASLTNSDEQIFAITYAIREGNCTVETGKNWKECGYKKSENQEQGKCTAKVKRENGKTFVVMEQNCHIAPVHEAVVAARGPCRGCFHSISTNSSDLEEILKHAVQYFNEKSNHEHIFALKEVLRASRQVVNGWNYKFQYSIIQTDCLKETDQLNSECQPKPQGEIRICSDSAYENAHMNISITSQTCKLENDSNSSVSPELREPLRHCLEKINSENKSNFYFKTLRILKAEPLVGSGTGYAIEFYIKETECFKEEEKYSEYCEFNELGNVLKCTADVLEEEEGIFNPTVLCEEAIQMLMKRPPGFSPFRSSLAKLPLESRVPGEPQASDITEQEEEQATETGQGLTPRGYGRGHRKGQTHPGRGLGNKHGHGHGQGHKYKHGQGHWKHEQKDKESHGTNEYLNSPNEGNSPSKIQEETQGPPPLHSPSPQGDAVTSSYFSDFDLLGPNPTNPPSEPSTQEKEKAGEEDDIEDDDLIPDIFVEPKSFLFPSLPDLPEPKCPGQPWKPVEVMDQRTEEREDDVFNLSDAI